jgi:hypothetical protein
MSVAPRNAIGNRPSECDGTDSTEDDLPAIIDRVSGSIPMSTVFVSLEQFEDVLRKHFETFQVLSAYEANDAEGTPVKRVVYQAYRPRASHR